MKRKSAITRITRYIFLFTQLYWFVWLCIGIHHSFYGMSDGWLIPSLANPNHMICGFEAFYDTIWQCIIYTIATSYVVIPVYQVIYVIVRIVQKHNKH